MAKIKIDDVEYETDDFSRETQAIFNTIRFVENELAHCRNQMAVLQTARTSYLNSLKEALPKQGKK
jgi:hypothetical protein